MFGKLGIWHNSFRLIYMLDICLFIFLKTALYFKWSIIFKCFVLAVVWSIAIVNSMKID